MCVIPSFFKYMEERIADVRMIGFLCKKNCVRVQMCICTYTLHYVLPVNSPHNDNDKVQHVPAVSDVGVLVHHQTVGNNLQKCLYCENDEEGILYCLLHRGNGNKEENRCKEERGGKQ